MREATRQALSQELGRSLPFFLEDLDEREQDDLARVLEDARTRQAEALEHAIDGSMRFLPWGIRGAVRKVLLG